MGPFMSVFSKPLTCNVAGLAAEERCLWVAYNNAEDITMLFTFTVHKHKGILWLSLIVNRSRCCCCLKQQQQQNFNLK